MTRTEDTLSPEVSDSQELDLQTSLRPDTFSAYTGQERETSNIKVFVSAAKNRSEALCHLLLSGPPGLGKTTLAYICAREMGVNIHVTSGPALERKGDLAGILTSLEERDILFIDEIHRLNAVIEENLYPAMEDFEFDIVIGEGPHARSIKLALPRFTLIGATTRAGLLTNPLRDRFGHVARLEYYQPEELDIIVRRSAALLKIEVDKRASMEIAKRSRGTPRIANRLLARVRDFASVADKKAIDLDLASSSLERLGVDARGFDWMDRKYLETLVLMFDSGPVGLDTLAAAIGEHSNTIEDVYEPYLIQQGFLHRTPRGRVATRRAIEHVRNTKKLIGQGRLF